MNTTPPTKPAGWFSGRTRLITIVSIVAVALAGAAAVSANVGILDAATESEVGNVSVAGDLTPLAPQVVDVYLPADASSTTSLPTVGSTSTTLAEVAATTTNVPTGIASGIQEFAVDAAGTVALATTETGLRLERVAPTHGWTWRLAQNSQTELMVVMTNGVRTLEFVAVMTPDGNIAASVNEPVITQAPPVTSGNSGDDFDDDRDDDDQYDDDRDDDDEYDDSDDDDSDDDDSDDDDSDDDEYEGGDDDD
jgi:hypothetical protein